MYVCRWLSCVGAGSSCTVCVLRVHLHTCSNTLFDAHVDMAQEFTEAGLLDVLSVLESLCAIARHAQDAEAAVPTVAPVKASARSPYGSTPAATAAATGTR